MKIFENIEEMRRACYGNNLDISGGMNSNNLAYDPVNKHWMMFWSVGGEFKSYNDEEIKGIAEEQGFLKDEDGNLTFAINYIKEVRGKSYVKAKTLEEAEAVVEEGEFDDPVIYQVNIEIINK